MIYLIRDIFHQKEEYPNAKGEPKNIEDVLNTKDVNNEEIKLIYLRKIKYIK